MSAPYQQHPMRREARSFSPEQCLTLLRQGEWGVLSLAGENGQPYGVPLNYALDEHAAGQHVESELASGHAAGHIAGEHAAGEHAGSHLACGHAAGQHVESELASGHAAGQHVESELASGHAAGQHVESELASGHAAGHIAGEHAAGQHAGSHLACGQIAGHMAGQHAGSHMTNAHIPAPRLLFHCARQGLKLDVLDRFPEACFTVVTTAETRPAALTTRYESVMVFGPVHRLEGEEAAATLRRLGERFCSDFPDELERELAAAGHKVVMLALDIRGMTGKFNPGT